LYQTPRARLFWRTLADWVDIAHLLEKRNASRLKNTQCVLHVRALPLRIIWEEGSLETLQAAYDLLTGFSGFRQPPRGQRAEAPHTPLISAIRNRMKKLERDQDKDSIPDGHNSLSMRPSMMMDFYNG
jgi:hypothetical protein